MTDVRLSRPGQATQPVAELPLRMPLPLHACNPWVASICWFSHRILVYIYIYIYTYCWFLWNSACACLHDVNHISNVKTSIELTRKPLEQAYQRRPSLLALNFSYNSNVWQPRSAAIRLALLGMVCAISAPSSRSFIHSFCKSQHGANHDHSTNSLKEPLSKLALFLPLRIDSIQTSLTHREFNDCVHKPDLE